MVVADNGSEDGSLEYLSTLEEVQPILGQNYGYAEGIHCHTELNTSLCATAE